MHVRINERSNARPQVSEPGLEYVRAKKLNAIQYRHVSGTYRGTFRDSFRGTQKSYQFLSHVYKLVCKWTEVA